MKTGSGTVWLLAALLVSGAADAGTLTATISGIAPTVPVSPVAPTPPTVVSPTVSLAHTGTVGGPDFTLVSVSISFNAAELSFLGTPTAGWSCSPSIGVVACSGPDIPVNQSRAMVADFQVRGGTGTSGTQIAVSPSGVDGGTPVFVNGMIAFTVTERTDLGLAAPATLMVPLGASAPLVIDVVRVSGDPAQPANLWNNLRVGLNVPAALRYGGAAAAGWVCPAAAPSPGGTFQCVRSGNATGMPPENITVQVFGVVAGSSQSLTAQLQHDSQDLNAANNSSSTLVTVGSLGADLAAQITAPTSVVNGASFNIDLQVSNAGPGAASNVVADLTLDTALEVTTRPAACMVLSPGSFRCSAAALASAGSISFPFLARHVQSGGVQVGGAVSVSAAETDPSPTNNSSSFSVNVTPSSDLALALSDSPDPVNPQSEFVVEAAVRNLGPDTTDAVQLTYDIPSNAVFLDASTPTGPGTPMNCSPSGAQVICVLSTLPSGQSASAAIRLQAPDSGTVVTNASVSAENPDPVASNNSDSETTNVRPPSRLTLSKSPSSGSVAAGAEFFYRLQVSNVGSATASGLIVLDNVPDNQSITAVEGGAFNCTTTGQAVDCRLGSLGAGASSEIILRVRAPALPGTLSNSASVTSSQERTPINASATVQVTATAGLVDLQLSKSDTVDPVQPGAEFEYLLVVTNNGTADAGAFSISDNLPAGVVLLAASGNEWSCSGSQALLCSYAGRLAPGASTTVRLSVRAPLQEGELSNTALLSALPGESDLTNNTDSETTLVRSSVGTNNQLDLGISGSLSNTAPTPGAEIVLNVVARNNDSSIDALNVQLCGQVNAAAGALELLQFGAPGVSCTISGGRSVTCAISRLNVGQQLAFSGTARVGAAAVVGSTVGLDLEVGCGSPDARPLDNTLSLRAVIAAPAANAPADLAAFLSVSPDPVPLGETAAIRIELRNAGAGVATGVSAATSLGSGFRYEGFSGTGWNCNAAAASINCQYAPALQPLLSTVLTLNVTAIGPAGSFETSLLAGSTSTDPVPGNNRASRSVTIGAATDPEAIAESLAPATALDPIAGDAAPVVADICANPAAELVAQCNALLSAAASGNQQDVVAGLRALFPEEVAAQSLSLSQAAATQFSNVDGRLNELRGGGSGFSASGLALGFGKQTLSLGLLRGLLDDSEGDPEIGESGDLITPWGGFISGNLSRGEQDTGDGSRRVVSDFESYGLTAGVDYRRSARWVLGAALGYADFSSDVTDGGSLSTKGFTLTGYSAWYPRDRVYLDTRISYAMLDLDMRRRVNFESGGFVLDRVAVGSTDSNQLSFAASTGYHLARGVWNFTPSASLRYLRNEIDGFTESGAGANSVIYGDQDFDSLQVTVGLQMSRVFSLSNGVLSPQLDVSFSRELQDEDLLIDARLVGAGAGQVFQVRAEEPDHNFGHIGLGFVYVGPNGRQAYVSYRELIGSDGTDRGTLTVGGRFEF